MTRLTLARLVASGVLVVLAVLPGPLDAQTVYRLSPTAFICQGRQDHTVYEQLVQAGDTAAALEYARDRCRYLASELNWEFQVGPLEAMTPDRRRLFELFFEELRRADSYWPSDKPAYVFVSSVLPPGLPLGGERRPEPDPMEQHLVRIRMIDDEPLFRGCYGCESIGWVKSEDLAPLTEDPGTWRRL